jgi:flagellar biosynthesis/type III secretory pathway M-ring protein FliF/YscJ
LLLLVGAAILLVGFIAFRLVSREMERRRRLREEELSRQQQAMRESALLEAENEGVEVSMSVEESGGWNFRRAPSIWRKNIPGMWPSLSEPG